MLASRPEFSRKHETFFTDVEKVRGVPHCLLVRHGDILLVALALIEGRNINIHRQISEFLGQFLAFEQLKVDGVDGLMAFSICLRRSGSNLDALTGEGILEMLSELSGGETALVLVTASCGVMPWSQMPLS